MQTPARPLPERFEIKYVVPAPTWTSFVGDLRHWLDLDPHCGPEGTPYAVESLYFDTAALDGYFDKKDGVQHRRKFRIRRYGVDASPWFFEMKQRNTRRTVKRKTPINPQQAEAFAAGRSGAILATNPLVGEFGRARALQGLRPVLCVGYHRLAFVRPGAGRLRITVDTRIEAQKARSLEERSGPTVPLYPPGIAVLEVKYDGRMPFWVHGMIEKYSLREASFSKYCLAVERLAERGVLPYV